MDERPETTSTAEILLAELVALFGQKTVSVKMWRGQGNNPRPTRSTATWPWTAPRASPRGRPAG